MTQMAPQMLAKMQLGFNQELLVSYQSTPQQRLNA
jgi:hypothetical protein